MDNPQNFKEQFDESKLPPKLACKILIVVPHCFNEFFKFQYDRFSNIKKCLEHGEHDWDKQDY